MLCGDCPSLPIELSEVGIPQTVSISQRICFSKSFTTSRSYLRCRRHPIVVVAEFMERARRQRCENVTLRCEHVTLRCEHVTLRGECVSSVSRICHVRLRNLTLRFGDAL